MTFVMQSQDRKKFWGELKKIKKYRLKEIISRNHNFKYGTGILTLK